MVDDIRNEKRARCRDRPLIGPYMRSGSGGRGEGRYLSAFSLAR